MQGVCGGTRELPKAGLDAALVPVEKATFFCLIAFGPFLEAFEAHIDLLGALDPTRPLPTDGMVQLRALTYTGAIGASVAEEELGAGDHPLSPIFFAGHNVITALRQIPRAGR